MNRILTLVPARPGRPALGEVFQKPARIVERGNWLAVYYDGERIAKVKDGSLASAESILANKRAEEAAAVEAHNAKVRAILEAQEAEAKEAAARAAEALAQEAEARASEGGEAPEAQASEGEPLTETQTEAEAPKAVSHVSRRPSRPRKPRK